MEQLRKRKRLTDCALAWESFQDWWASVRSTPSTGTSSDPQSPLVTPPINPVPGPSAAALSSSTQSMALSHRFWQSPGPRPVLDRAHSSSVWISVASAPSWTSHPCACRLPTRDPSPRHSRTRHLAVPGPIYQSETHHLTAPGPVTRLGAVTASGTHIPEMQSGYMHHTLEQVRLG